MKRSMMTVRWLGVFICLFAQAKWLIGAETNATHSYEWIEEVDGEDQTNDYEVTIRLVDSESEFVCKDKDVQFAAEVWCVRAEDGSNVTANLQVYIEGDGSTNDYDSVTNTVKATKAGVDQLQHYAYAHGSETTGVVCVDVYGLELTPTNAYISADSGQCKPFALTNSYSGGGGYNWSIAPHTDVTVTRDGTNVCYVQPSTESHGEFTVTGSIPDMPDCPTHSATLQVVRVDIEQAATTNYIKDSPVSLSLTNSHSPAGYHWAWPAELSGAVDGDGAFTYDPATSSAGVHRVTCESHDIASCVDTALVTVVRVESISVWDNDNRYAQDSLLEVVAGPITKVSAEANPFPCGTAFPQSTPPWTLNGQNVKKGSATSYFVNAGIMEGIFGWLEPSTYILSADGVECTVKAYSSEHQSYTYDCGKWTTQVLQKLGTVPAFKHEVESCLLLPDGSITYENWYAERPNSNTVMYAFQFDAGLDPWFGLATEWQITGIPLPRVLRKVAEAGIYFTTEGKVTMIGNAHRNPESTGAQGGPTGSITLGIEGRVTAEPAVSVIMSGSSSFVASGQFGVDNNAIYFDPTVKIGGLDTSVRVAFFSGKVKFQRKWQPLDPLDIEMERVDFVKWPTK